MDFYIDVALSYLIHGFSTREEAENFVKNNQSLLSQIAKNDGQDEKEINIFSRKDIASLLEECFFNNEGTANYDPQWVDKNYDLKRLL